MVSPILPCLSDSDSRVGMHFTTVPVPVKRVRQLLTFLNFRIKECFKSMLQIFHLIFLLIPKIHMYGNYQVLTLALG